MTLLAVLLVAVVVVGVLEDGAYTPWGRNASNRKTVNYWSPVPRGRRLD